VATVDVHVAVDAAVQAEEPQARVLRRRRGADERGHAAPVQRDQVPGQRLDPGPVAGRADNYIGSAAGAVGEADPWTVEPVDAGLHDHPAGLQRAGEAVVHRDRDAVGALPGEGTEGGHRVAEPAEVAERQPLHGAGRDVLPAHRHAPQRDADRVQRDAAESAWRDRHT